ncbi:acyltransferase family protein [Chitinimonas sp.]|uniref:acyltransferase family protein n=1 Tax=Chitinimonas sp. TaxID=1934313 RepID=UPI0035AF185C
MAVFIHHAQVTFGGAVPFFGDYGGQFGPQMFFLISGYLISASAIKYNIRQYIVHRCFRIFPAYWLFFVGIGVYVGALTLASISAKPWHFISNMVLLQHLFPEALKGMDVLHVTWTLTVEVLWYALLPLLLLLFKRIDFKVVVAATLLSTAYVYGAGKGVFDFVFPSIAKDQGMHFLFLENNFLGQLCFFVYGAYIYQQREWLKTFNPVGMCCLAMLMFVLRPYYFAIMNPIFFTGIALSALFIVAIACPPWQFRPAHFISEISYSIYLCHFPILLYVRHVRQVEGFSGALLGLALTLLVSIVSYALVERPGIALGKRIADRLK